jgi:transposase
LDSEERITLAITAVQNSTSRRAAAQMYGVSRSTLAYQLYGGKNRKKANENNQLLSPNLKDYLVNLILNLKKASKTPYR